MVNRLPVVISDFAVKEGGTVAVSIGGVSVRGAGTSYYEEGDSKTSFSVPEEAVAAVVIVWANKPSDIDGEMTTVVYGMGVLRGGEEGPLEIREGYTPDHRVVATAQIDGTLSGRRLELSDSAKEEEDKHFQFLTTFASEPHVEFFVPGYTQGPLLMEGSMMTLWKLDTGTPQQTATLWEQLQRFAMYVYGVARPATIKAGFLMLGLAAPLLSTSLGYVTDGIRTRESGFKMGEWWWTAFAPFVAAALARGAGDCEDLTHLATHLVYNLKDLDESAVTPEIRAVWEAAQRTTPIMVTAWAGGGRVGRVDEGGAGHFFSLLYPTSVARRMAGLPVEDDGMLSEQGLVIEGTGQFYPVCPFDSDDTREMAALRAHIELLLPTAPEHAAIVRYQNFHNPDASWYKTCFQGYARPQDGLDGFMEFFFQELGCPYGASIRTAVSGPPGVLVPLKTSKFSDEYVAEKAGLLNDLFRSPSVLPADDFSLPERKERGVVARSRSAQSAQALVDLVESMEPVRIRASEIQEMTAPGGVRLWAVELEFD